MAGQYSPALVHQDELRLGAATVDTEEYVHL
jgi:hypothetical protein